MFELWKHVRLFFQNSYGRRSHQSPGLISTLQYTLSEFVINCPSRFDFHHQSRQTHILLLLVNLSLKHTHTLSPSIFLSEPRGKKLDHTIDNTYTHPNTVLEKWQYYQLSKSCWLSSSLWWSFYFVLCAAFLFFFLWTDPLIFKVFNISVWNHLSPKVMWS